VRHAISGHKIVMLYMAHGFRPYDSDALHIDAKVPTWFPILIKSFDFLFQSEGRRKRKGMGGITKRED